MAAGCDHDLLVVGAGAAGLLLVRALARSRWRTARVLVVDERWDASADGDGEQRWAYWAPGPEPLARHRWDRIEVTTTAGRQVLDPSPYRYWQVTGDDLRASAVREAGAAGLDITFVHGRVEAVADGRDCAQVVTDAGTVSARWVVDTAVAAAMPPAGMRLWFCGRLVELGRPYPTPGTATLIDQAHGHDDAFGFGYLLPYSDHEVFAEVTRFAPGSARPHGAPDEQDLEAFIGARLGECAPHATDREIEVASIPLYPRRGARRRGWRVLAAGTPGGLVRASTGYGFVRMRTDAAAIAASLERYGHPFDVATFPTRHATLDAIMLEVMRTDPAAVGSAFDRLFAANPTHRVLRFLDGRTSRREDASIIATLPSAPFVTAAARLVARP